MGLSRKKRSKPKSNSFARRGTVHQTLGLSQSEGRRLSAGRFDGPSRPPARGDGDDEDGDEDEDEEDVQRQAGRDDGAESGNDDRDHGSGNRAMDLDDDEGRGGGGSDFDFNEHKYTSHENLKCSKNMLIMGFVIKVTNENDVECDFTVLCSVLVFNVGVKDDLGGFPFFGGFCPTYGPKRKFFFKKSLFSLCPHNLL